MAKLDVERVLCACAYFEQGMFNEDDICRQIAFIFVDSQDPQECLSVLPKKIVEVLRDWTAELPVTEEGWAGFHFGGIIDETPGKTDEQKYSDMLQTFLEDRRRAESVREYLSQH